MAADAAFPGTLNSGDTGNGGDGDDDEGSFHDISAGDTPRSSWVRAAAAARAVCMHSSCQIEPWSAAASHPAPEVADPLSAGFSMPTGTRAVAAAWMTRAANSASLLCLRT